jgi:hypothetical protein
MKNSEIDMNNTIRNALNNTINHTIQNALNNVLHNTISNIELREAAVWDGQVEGTRQKIIF